MPAVSRLLISATHKSSGKTVFATGLCAELARRGYDVRPFKKGPDYIDPQWLAAAAGRDCYNLDFNTQAPDEIARMFIDKSRFRSDSTGEAARADPRPVAIIEANKGLHDGVSPDGSDSNAALAGHLAAPVVLVLDCEGMTRGIAPLLRGYIDFDPAVQLAGVVLNKVGGPRHADKLRTAVSRYTGVPVVGCVMRDERMALPERHLGLVPGGEHEQPRERIEAMRRAVAEYTDVEALLELARGADELEVAPRGLNDAAGERGIEPGVSASPGKVRLGIFRDSAFNFYYPDDLEALERAGFGLVPIDALRAPALPDVDALFIGGGFPETHAAALEANTSLRGAVREAIESGLPAYAECGGLMYLSRGIEWRGRRYEMVGVIPADTVMCDQPRGRGYVQLEETPDMPWPPASGARPVRAAHEFHYSKLVGLPENVKTAYKVLRGEGIGGGRDGVVYKNLLASFVHLRAVNNAWTERFRALCE